MRGTTKGALLALAIASAASGTAQADTRNARFEPPAYGTGSVHNQQGWSSSGSYDRSIVPVSSFPGVPASMFGLQALRISNAVTSSSLTDQTYSMETPNEAGEASAENAGRSGGVRQRFFDARWTFISAVPGAEQAGLSVVVGPDRGDGAQMSWVEMADSPGGIDVNFKQAESDARVPVAADLARNAPHTIRISMEFVPGADNDVVKVFVDDVLRHTGRSWEQTYRALAGATSRTVDSLLFRTSGAAAPGTAGNGFLVDDVTLSTPEALSDPSNGAVGPQGPAGADGVAGATGATGAAGPAGPAGAPAPARAAAPLGFASSARFSAKRRTVTVPVTCPKAAVFCEGKLLLRNGGRTAGRQTILVRGTGRAMRVSIPVSRATARALGRGLKRLTLAARSLDGAGLASQATRQLKVR